jgi:hypothetical protein
MVRILLTRLQLQPNTGAQTDERLPRTCPCLESLRSRFRHHYHLPGVLNKGRSGRTSIWPCVMLMHSLCLLTQALHAYECSWSFTHTLLFCEFLDFWRYRWRHLASVESPLARTLCSFASLSEPIPLSAKLSLRRERSDDIMLRGYSEPSDSVPFSA